MQFILEWFSQLGMSDFWMKSLMFFLPCTNSHNSKYGNFSVKNIDKLAKISVFKSYKNVFKLFRNSMLKFFQFQRLIEAIRLHFILIHVMLTCKVNKRLKLRVTRKVSQLNTFSSWAWLYMSRYLYVKCVSCWKLSTM